MTGRDLISASMRLIGTLASGEAPSNNEANDALNALNRLLDSWSTENLLIFTKVREVFPLVPSQQAYTIGTGANFNTSRPMKIETALLQVVATSPTLEIPMTILTEAEFASISVKGITSTYPTYLYSDGSFPTDNINVWPVPSQVNNLVLYSWKPLSNVAALSTAIAFPPGYERALVYGLALELSVEYGRAVPELVLAIANESKAAIKRMNTVPQYLRVDDALRAKSGVWNWMTGESS